MPLNGCGPGPGTGSNTSVSWSKKGSSLRASCCSSIGSSSSSQPAEDPVGEGVSGRTWENWISGESAIVAGAPKAQTAMRLKKAMTLIVRTTRVQQPPDSRCSQLQDHTLPSCQEKVGEREREKTKPTWPVHGLNPLDSSKQDCTD